MKIFKSVSFAWYEISALKVALLGIGVLIGANWPDIIHDWSLPILIAAIVASVYGTLV